MRVFTGFLPESAMCVRCKTGMLFAIEAAFMSSILNKK
jgi:hypothetical protein